MESADELIKQVLSAGVDTLAYIITSGGTERMIFESAKTLHSHLSAGQFVGQFLRRSLRSAPKDQIHGKRAKPIFSEKIDETAVREMNQIDEIPEVIQKFRRTRLGLIGEPSP